MHLGASLLSLALPLAALGISHGSIHNSRHQQIAKRQSGDVELHKRFSSARWSFYDVGLGACGKYNVESDFIVALNTPQYGGGYPGPNCFKSITMTYNGKTAQAVIMDQCPGCPYGGLDLSRSLFRFFAPESVGILYGEWHFNGEGGGSPPPPPPPPPKPKPPKPSTSKWIPLPLPPKPTPKTTYKPEPTPTYKPEPEKTTSSKPKPTFTTTSDEHESTSPAKSTPSTSGSKTGLVPAPAPAPTLVDQTSNIQDMNKAFIGFGGIALAGVAA